MVDPTGFVSLGLEGAGRVLKIRSTIANRRRLIAQLAERVDTAHALLLSENAGDYAAIYSEILSPHIDAAVALLETVNARSRAEAFKCTVILPEADAAEACRLIQAFEQAPKDIELRCIHQAVKTLMMVAQSSASLPRGGEAKLRNLHLFIAALTCFLSSGETSVTPQCIETTC